MGQYLTQIEQVLDQQSMTQKDLANKIGTSASYISQFFNLNKLINA
jgi:transcriptional regulator with XRE-family HTH domain